MDPTHSNFCLWQCTAVALPSVLCLSRASLRVVLPEAFTECTTPLGKEGGQVKSWRLGPSVLSAQCAKWKNLPTIHFLKPAEVSSMVRITLCRYAFVFKQLLFPTIRVWSKLDLWSDCKTFVLLKFLSLIRTVFFQLLNYFRTEG